MLDRNKLKTDPYENLFLLAVLSKIAFICSFLRANSRDKVSWTIDTYPQA